MKRQKFLARGGAAASRGGTGGAPRARSEGGRAAAAPFGTDPCRGRAAPPAAGPANPALGGGPARGRSVGAPAAAPPSPTTAQPPSPLSRLVQDGYSAPPLPQNPACAPALPPRAPGGGNADRRQNAGGNFDAAVAQQWSNSVQQTTEAHQQHHDPNFRGMYRKPQGYRVSQAPGGGSSISLTWGAEQAAGAGGAGGAGGAAGGVLGAGVAPGVAGTAAQRYSSPFGGATPSSKAAMRNPSPLQQAGMRAASPGPAMRAPSPLRGDDYSRHRAPSPHHRQQRNPVRDRSLDYDSKGSPFGSAGGGKSSSNAYACGANQNCGNGITDRRMTRINAPPGGGSSVVFG